MAKPHPKTKVSAYFKLGRDQTTIDFVDVPIGNDVRVFLDPSALRLINSEWAAECNSLLQHYFETLLRYLKEGRDQRGTALLASLSEKNEFHLGFSSGLSHGTGLGLGFARTIWNELRQSKAGSTGLLQDLEDTCLFIEGIGPDRISDAVCNIIRGPLIKYTQDMCIYYDIPLQQGVDSGPVWDPEGERWTSKLVALPITPYGKLLLVPKVAVRHRLAYNSARYYTHYLLPEMMISERSMNSALVETLKDGRQRVTKKALKAKYGVDKLAIVDQTLRHPEALNKYREDAKRASAPLSHFEFSAIENIDIPRFNNLLADVLSVPPGRDHADTYERAIEKLLSALFFPSLASPTKQHRIHEGRKRIDITYVNNPREGFFWWLLNHYTCPNIFVECKNYGNEIGNPELDQLAGRFSPSRGKVGLLICRAVKDLDRIKKSCIDTLNDQRGYIVVLTDEDLRRLVKDYIQSNGSSEYPWLFDRFKELL